MNVKSLMKTYSPVYPSGNQTWEGVIAFYQDNPYEQFKVDTLIQVLETGHHFREPVSLDKTTLRVVDGTHRLIASYLAGREEIDVEYREGHEEEPDTEGVQSSMNSELSTTEVWIETKVRIHLSLDRDFEDTLDETMGVCMSVPVSNEFWATSSVCSIGNLQVDRSVVFEIPWDSSSDFTSEEVKSLENTLKTHLDNIDGVTVLSIQSEQLVD